MNGHRRASALISGFMLYSTGMLMSTALGASVFDRLLLDGLNQVLPFTTAVLARAGLTALPVLALALIWTWLSLRHRQRSRAQITMWHLLGLCLGMSAWVGAGLVMMALENDQARWSALSLLTKADTPPLHGAQNIVALWLGSWLGLRLLPRREVKEGNEALSPRARVKSSAAHQARAPLTKSV